jgi:hypothetical protein
MQKTLIKLVTMLLMGFSGCAVQRPNADVCIVNAPAGNRKCYNLSRDYDDNGMLIPGHAATYRVNTTVKDLNKAAIIDSPTGFTDGLAALKAYIAEMRKEYQNNCQPLTNGIQ